MRVAVIGATGLVGSAICAGLANGGHDVRGIVHTRRSRCFSCQSTFVMDVGRARLADWNAALGDVQAVVNCAGVLQDSASEDVSGVHSNGIATLVASCGQAGIARLIHFSAIGVDRAQPSSFSKSKLAGDRIVMATELDWVILRPSVILGAPVFGASALMRGLAALPWLPSMPATERLQPVQLDDVVATVVHFLKEDSQARIVLELPGPRTFTMDELVAKYRDWMGWPPAKLVQIPTWLATVIYRFGDVAGMLGWRPPIRTNAQKEILRGATGDVVPWTAATGINPTSIEAALTARPATVQDRWFAGLYFLKPLIFVVLPFFWIMTGIISLTIGWDSGVNLMAVGGAGALAEPSVVAGALADILVGVLVAWRKTARLGLQAALALSIFYGIAGSIIRPDLWAEPLGPLMKILPIVLLHFTALSILKER
ncbi:nucleoside-diphosphate sugar epimerase [Aminobacter sp. DSM 101952]|uniref:SDR family oxidoreductase n=1 Tax=Aminobacter sp. DSM 101952 TaxID=2735891 RepID=UPI0006F415C7|nr:SDR family oxidoreductase [Aminobacter sp. DSM 101952]KQU72395.1 nucleoside-diphosphate sugar epimerase [Aminobacter sp. DSM 101952]